MDILACESRDMTGNLYRQIRFDEKKGVDGGIPVLEGPLQQYKFLIRPAKTTLF